MANDSGSRALALERMFTDAPTKARLPAYVKCLVLACLGLVPFLAVLTRDMDPSDFHACDDECYFVRYAGVPSLPSTAVENVERTTGNKTGWWPSFPLFVAVQTGQSVQASYPPILSPWVWLQTPGAAYFLGPYMYTAAVLLLDNSSHTEFISSANATPTQCQEYDTRTKIENHLVQGRIRVIYLVAVIAWIACILVHDWSLLAGVHERVTLKIALVLFWCQLFSCVAAFVWGTGAAEVFVEPDSGCYYRLKTVVTLLAVLPPFLLLAVTEQKYHRLVLSVCHGDYLYSVQYSVPFRAAEATVPSDPSASLLSPALRGDSGAEGRGGVEACPAPRLSLPEIQEMEWMLTWTYMFWCLAQHLIIAPFAVGPLFRRILQVSKTWRWAFDAFGILKFGVLALMIGSVVAGLYPAFRLCRACPTNFFSDQEREDTGVCLRIRRLATRATNLFALCFGPVFSVGAVWKIWRWWQGELLTDNVLDDSWLWYLHGTSAFIHASISCSMLPAFKDPTIMLRARALHLNFELEKRSLAEVHTNHPDWLMAPYLSNKNREVLTKRGSQLLETEADDSECGLMYPDSGGPRVSGARSSAFDANAKRSFQTIIDSWN
ncbi:aglC [Symbiodinium sp. CCMP2592]|nr:aglC [Symbiodinium sp. CCMP2592]